MGLIQPSERHFLQILSKVAYCNPFLPQRVELEREALGGEFVDAPVAYSRRAAWALDHVHPNVDALGRRAEGLAAQLRQRLADGMAATEAELRLYEDLVLYLLYRPSRPDLDQTIAAALERPDEQPPIFFWKRFLKDFDHHLRIPGRTLPGRYDSAQVFAGFFQIRRAFYHIYCNIIGASMPAVRLRGAVWQSIFTHDMRRYARALYLRMGDITTLITGPSGTGKELVARAVGLSGYIPFDPQKEQFTADFAGAFFAVNLSALAPTLIESELFGHARGAFTGAVEDRVGWLEECVSPGAVFLDEIGELDPAIQVKLLRVLQTRSFQRLGETKQRQFQGKIIAATHRDLAAEMRAGRFREDLYYRLCADMIATPSLREQLADSPHDLHDLIVFITEREVGEEAEALAAEVEAWIDVHLGREYPWPGNVRELEQCVRNVMVRNEYRPARLAADDAAADPRRALAAAAADGTLTAEELLRRYCTLVYAQSGSFQEAARRLKLDRRTVKSKIDYELLQGLAR